MNLSARRPRAHILLVVCALLALIVGASAIDTAAAHHSPAAVGLSLSVAEADPALALDVDGEGGEVEAVHAGPAGARLLSVSSSTAHRLLRPSALPDIPPEISR